MKCSHIILIYSNTCIIMEIFREVILIVLKIIIIYGIVPNKIMKSHTSNYDMCLLLSQNVPFIL
jgi:hypothetical protein